MDRRYFHLRLDVRSYEIDSFGHVNNAVYLQWLEQGRSALARAWGLEAGGPLGLLPVLRHISLDFQAEVIWGDSIELSIWPRRVGNTSMLLGGRVRIVSASQPARQDRVALVAEQTLVCIRRGIGKIPVPDAWRQAFPAEDPG